MPPGAMRGEAAAALRGESVLLEQVCTAEASFPPDIVSNKIVHFDLLHEDASLQYFIPALS